MEWLNGLVSTPFSFFNIMNPLIDNDIVDIESACMCCTWSNLYQWWYSDWLTSYYIHTTKSTKQKCGIIVNLSYL